MGFKTLKCPHCNPTISVNVPTDRYVSCIYCGQGFYADDGSKRIYKYNHNYSYSETKHHEIYTNDADVIRARNEDKSERRAFTFLLLLLLIAFFICGFGAYIYPMLEEAYNNKLMEQAVEQGKISAGNSQELIGENYKAVEAIFESAGFTNVKTVDLDDSGVFLWKNEKVAQISIAGQTSFDENDYFDHDSNVVISYH
ncbi:MAG: hypothetical protein J6I55_12290 [Ruminococcus sp.]|nr:hypothetical protein [Ruminococcus sp.]